MKYPFEFLNRFQYRITLRTMASLMFLRGQQKTRQQKAWRGAYALAEFVSRPQAE